MSSMALKDFSWERMAAAVEDVRERVIRRSRCATASRNSPCRDRWSRRRLVGCACRSRKLFEIQKTLTCWSNVPIFRASSRFSNPSASFTRTSRASICSSTDPTAPSVAPCTSSSPVRKWRRSEYVLPTPDGQRVRARP